MPYASMKEAGDPLAGMGHPVYGYTMHDTGHGISPEGLGQTVGFLRQTFGIAPAPEADESVSD